MNNSPTSLGRITRLLRPSTTALLLAFTPLTTVMADTGAPTLAKIPYSNNPKQHGLAVLAMAGDQAAIPTADDFNATAWLSWDEAGIHLLVAITDDIYSEHPVTASAFKRDSVEFMMKPSESSSEMVQIIVKPRPTGATAASPYYLFDYRKSEDLRKLKVQGKGNASAIDEHRFLVEALLPFSNLGITPKAGQTVAVKLYVNDNDTTLPPEERGGEGDRYRSGWPSPGEPYVTLELAADDKPAIAQDSAVWIENNAFETMVVNVLTTPQAAGKTLTVSYEGQILGSTPITTSQSRASAHLELPWSVTEKPMTGWVIAIDDKPVTLTSALPNLEAEKMDAFHAGLGTNHWFTPPAWAVLQFNPGKVFKGTVFPTLKYADASKVERLAGAVSVTTRYFDAAYNEVTIPAGVGRYGAVSVVTPSIGKPVTLYNTLFKQTADWRDFSIDPAGGSPESLAALYEAKGGAVAVPDFANEHWWQGLKKKIGGATVYPYLTFLPKDFKTQKDKRWPVLLYLHGSGGGRSLEHLEKEEMRFVLPKAQEYPWIIIAPQSFGGWNVAAVQDVLDEVERKYPVDTDRIYVSGFSMGGSGTWRAAIGLTGRIAAAAPSAGWVTYELADRVKDLPLYIIHGENDETVSYSSAHAMYDALAAIQGRVRMTVFNGAGHVVCHNRTYVDTDVFYWFLQQRRGHPSQPKFTGDAAKAIEYK
ncbi:MAG: prolyl oligopeptidase family serine peptidase [Verrucomicrobiota bacterium]|nr:prolyl oligopeptidase family serine peptidase [Verrucomicrobiota bacterium]